jgi:hypothetical protein
MPNNSIESITENIIRSLEFEDIESITNRALELIKKKYTFQARAAEFEKVIQVNSRTTSINR